LIPPWLGRSGSAAKRAVALVALAALGAVAAGCWPPAPGAGPTGDATTGATPSAAPVATRAATAAPSATPDLPERLARNAMAPRDYVTLVSEFTGSARPIPRVVRETPAPIAEGDARRFWLGDSDTSRTYEITATLRLLSEHTQMWVEDGIPLEREALAASAQVFDAHIYPTLREAFGSEWNPGVDGDPRIVILNARFTGAIGYFFSANEYSRAVNPYSNEAEMVFMNVGIVTPGSDAYDAVLAHEFQHMIHWHLDPNEDAWLNEGSSELAESLTGYGGSGTLGAYTGHPDVQLNTWSEEEGLLGAHYGASYLMLRYIMERYGADALSEVVESPANGVASLEAMLATRSPGLTVRDLIADWAVANHLDRTDLAEGRYGYRGADPRAAPEARLTALPAAYEGSVAQYASDYIAVAPPPTGGTLRLTLDGRATVPLVPNAPASGDYQWWSNRGDASHATLERTLDLRAVRGASLTYDLWYDIETGWDYAYLRASTDGGRTWTVLRGNHMSDYNPNGNALAPGYTGVSGTDPERGAKGAEPAWVREAVDLTPLAGKRVLLRFDYVTDDAVNLPGMCLDNFAVEAIGWADDVEEGEEEWRTVGFVRHDNILPQEWVVSVIVPGPEPRVERFYAAPDGTGVWRVALPDGLEEDLIVVVTALAPTTTERAEYTVSVGIGAEK